MVSDAAVQRALPFSRARLNGLQLPHGVDATRSDIAPHSSELVLPRESSRTSWPSPDSRGRLTRGNEIGFEIGH
jgi:hypothetical protein